MEATKLIYPDGDLVLVVGSEAKLKRFKVLKMGKPVRTLEYFKQL